MMNRNRLSAFAVLLALGSAAAWAAPRALQSLKTAAAQALGTQQPVQVLAEREHLLVIGRADEGFAVMSRHEGQPAVLGVCTTGDGEAPNPALQWWLDAMDEALSHPAQLLPPADFDVPEAVEPLVKTRWGQTAPYNNLCPVGSDGTRCLTGCVATSTAQVLNYYQLPIRGRGSQTIFYPEGDATGTPVYAHFGATWYDWEHMRNEYRNQEYTDAEAQAVAELMLHAGVSADMAYGTESEGGSGAKSQVACQNLLRFFGVTQAQYESRDDHSEAEWMQMVFSQLATYGPIVYNASDQRGGHSFIIDGYRADGLVHVNWGYEGSGDGYYDIATLRPSFSSGGYSIGQNMMVIRMDPQERPYALDLSDLPLDNGQLPARVCYGRTSMTAVTLPAGITAWGDGALGACPSLRQVVLPGAEGRTFAVVDGQLLCSADTTELLAVLSTATGRVVLPATITTIRPNALDGCVGIDTLELPAALTRMGAEALRDCGGMSQLRVRAKTPPVLSGYDTFAGMRLGDCVLSVPSGSKATYARRAQWKDFATVDEFGTTIRANNAVRSVGEENPELGYTVQGVPVAGTPQLYTDATVSSPPGVYTIYVLPGTITDPDVEYVNGRLIVEEAEGISTPAAASAAPWVYTPAGVRVATGHGNVQPLPRGLYIVGRRKVLVR